MSKTKLSNELVAAIAATIAQHGATLVRIKPIRRARDHMAAWRSAARAEQVKSRLNWERDHEKI